MYLKSLNLYYVYITKFDDDLGTTSVRIRRRPLYFDLISTGEADEAGLRALARRGRGPQPQKPAPNRPSLVSSWSRTSEYFPPQLGRNSPNEKPAKVLSLLSQSGARLAYLLSKYERHRDTHF